MSERSAAISHIASPAPARHVRIATRQLHSPLAPFEAEMTSTASETSLLVKVEHGGSVRRVTFQSQSVDYATFRSKLAVRLCLHSDLAKLIVGRPPSLSLRTASNSASPTTTATNANSRLIPISKRPSASSPTTTAQAARLRHEGRGAR